MIYIRRFIPSDWLPVIAMARAFHSESPVHSKHPFSEDRIRDLLVTARASDDWLALTATDDEGELTGFALVTVQPMFYSDARELLDLAVYVSPDRRGAMTFIKLVGEIEAWGARMGAVGGQIGINTGINHAQAIRSFGKLGWHPGGVIVSKQFVQH